MAPVLDCASSFQSFKSFPMHLCLEAAVNFPNPLLDFATPLISMTSCDNDAEQKTAPKISSVCFKATRVVFQLRKINTSVQRNRE